MTTKMFNINELPVTKINNDYGWIEFNSVKIYVTNDKKMFNATKLFKSFKKEKLHFNVWITGTGKEFYNLFKDTFKEVEGKGTQEYKGFYADFELFHEILFSTDIAKASAWIRNKKNWDDLNEAGYIYLLQPPDLIGTDCFKIGESKNIGKRLDAKEYDKGTMVLGIRRVINRSKAEKSMKDYFSNNGANIVQGHEYFKVTDLDEAYKLFTSAILNGDSPKSEIRLFEPNEWIHKVSFPEDLELI